MKSNSKAFWKNRSESIWQKASNIVTTESLLKATSDLKKRNNNNELSKKNITYYSNTM